MGTRLPLEELKGQSSGTDHTGLFVEEKPQAFKGQLKWAGVWLIMLSVLVW